MHPQLISEGRSREPSRRFWGSLALCLGLDLILHIAVIGTGPAPVIDDAGEYWMMGGQIADGDLLLFRDAVPWRTPLYPAFLALMQLVSREHALFAVVVTQHILVWCTSILTGCLTVQLTGRRRWFLPGYLLSALCLTRAWFANAVLSESLFAFLLTAFFIAMVGHLRRPSGRTAVVSGGLLGLAVLTRAASQFLFVPLALLFLLRGSDEQKSTGRMRRIRPAALFVATLVGLILPWVVRNQLLFGEPFVARNFPRTRWNVCFQQGSAAGLPIPDDESGRRLLNAVQLPPDRIEGCHVTFVENRLREAGIGQDEMNEIFRDVCRSAIHRNPGRFVTAAAKRSVNYFRCVVRPYPFFGGRTVDQVPPDSVDFPHGQRLWRWSQWAKLGEPLLRRVLVGSLRWNEGVASVTLLGLALAVVHRPSRYAAFALGLTFLYFAAVTGVAVIENYRYRMILEPAMIAAALFGMQRILSVCKADGSQAELTRFGKRV